LQGLLERSVPAVRSPWILACALLGACGAEPAGSAAVELGQPVASAAPASAEPRLSQVLGDWIAKDWSAPRGLREEKCDEKRFTDLPPEARTLVLAVRDARFEKKQLLQLDLTGHLTQPKLHALRDDRARPARAAAEQPSATDRAARPAPIRGVFHVTSTTRQSACSGRSRTLGWLPGTLVAWLAIHDASSGRRCAGRSW
jgi:hypothetical protein